MRRRQVTAEIRIGDIFIFKMIWRTEFINYYSYNNFKMCVKMRILISVLLLSVTLLGLANADITVDYGKLVLQNLSSTVSPHMVGPQDNWALEKRIQLGEGSSREGPLLVDGDELFVGSSAGQFSVYSISQESFTGTLGDFSQINGALVLENGNLAVLDLSVPEVSIINPSSGIVVTKLFLSGMAVNTTTRRGLLGMDEKGDFYVADLDTSEIKVYNFQNGLTRSFGGAGNLVGQIKNEITSIAVRDNGDTYTTDGSFLYFYDGDGTHRNTVSLQSESVTLTNDGLPVAGDSVFGYDLSSNVTLDISLQGIGASDAEPKFSRDGRLWNYTNDHTGETVEVYRRKYAGVDEPAVDVARKAVPQPRIVSVAQRPGTTFLDIDYEVIDTDSETVEVRVIAWKEGSIDLADVVIPETWAEGTEANLGPNIPSNTVHRITWDTGADLVQPNTTFEIEILARDDQPPIPVHWISIPATEGVPAFEISKRPISASELKRLLLWDVAGEAPVLVTEGESLKSALNRLKAIVAYDATFNALLNTDDISLVTLEQRTIASNGRFGQDAVGNFSLYRGKQSADSTAFSMVEATGGDLPNIGNGALNVSDFLIGKYEVTDFEWTIVWSWAIQNGYTDLQSRGSDLFPVVSVNWYDVLKWCNALSEKEGLTPVYTVNGEVYRTGEVVPDQDLNAYGYRLPSEEEWEFAARGGNLSQGYEYSGSNDVDAVAWYSGNNTSSWLKVVGLKQANELGLHDMSGNVWEWCWDTWSSTNSARVIRGGIWNENAHYCRVAERNGSWPSDRYYGYGFRLCRSVSN